MQNQTNVTADMVQPIVHTPMPWVAHLHKEGSFSIKVAGDYDTSPTIASRNCWGTNAAESHANGKLISASPDLLLASLKAERLLGKILCGFFEVENEEVYRIMTAAKNAIDKATK